MDRLRLNEAGNPGTDAAREATFDAFPNMEYGPGASAENNLEIGLKPTQP